MLVGLVVSIGMLARPHIDDVIGCGLTSIPCCIINEVCKGLGLP